MAEFQQIRSGNKVAMRLFIDVPKKPSDIAQARVWNGFVKDAIRETLAHHHNKHMPRHFKRDARQRYQHKERNAKYKSWKKRKYGSLLDLVLTGRTRDKLTKPNGFDRITIGGAAIGGKKPVEGKLVYTFGFNQDLIDFYKSQKGKKSRDHRNAMRLGGMRVTLVNPNRVTLRDMRAELQTITEDEAADLRDVFRKGIWDRVNNYRAGRKQAGRK